MFSSALGLAILALVYAANIYAGQQIAVYKNQPAGLVCGVAAIAPIIGPIIFLCLPRKPAVPLHEQATVEAEAPATDTPVETTADAVTNIAAAPAAGFSSQSAPTIGAPHPAASAPTVQTPAPEPVVFRRGEVIFNRRFFETRMPGFFRVIPSESEKDLVLFVKAARGEFTGKRISRITQGELYLEIFKDNATAEEMIPFSEIMEVQIRPKNMA